MSGKNIFVITALVGLAIGLSGCNQDEQGRILSYEKGTYLGQADQKLGENPFAFCRGSGQPARVSEPSALTVWIV